MSNGETLNEDSSVRYIRLLTETIQRKLVDSYEVKQLSKKGSYSFYELKNKKIAGNSISIEATGILWQFTMNSGLDKLYVSFGSSQFVDEQGIVSLEDIVKGTRMYKHSGTPSFTYHKSKSSISLEEYLYGGGRDLDFRNTLRPVNRKKIREITELKRNHNQILTILITAQVALKMINYGPLEPMN